MLKKVIIGILLFSVIGVLLGSGVYRAVYMNNINTEKVPAILFITDQDSYEEVIEKLVSLDILKSVPTFEKIAEAKEYPNLVKAGRFIIDGKMSNNELVNMLRIGEQAPVKLSFNNVRTLTELAGKVAEKLEGDSLDFVNTLTNDSIMRHYGFGKRTYISMFIPNTYEVYWNTSPEKFIQRMAAEFKKFWTDERMAKARALGLTQSEVVTLASIVQEEQNMRYEEHKTIAGLYINRLRRGIALQSDPTVRFAVGDFTLNRILKAHLKVDSPYNTYKNPGLPPGPICMPDIRAIDAVLNYRSHDYIYMCAKADFSGYHHFTKNLREHQRYAREYRKALNDRRIYR